MVIQKANQGFGWEVGDGYIWRGTPYRGRHGDQAIIPELCRIPLSLQVLPDGRVAFFAKHAHRRRVETRDVKQHAPHAEVEDTTGLIKHAPQALRGPLERATIARDAERLLGRYHLDTWLTQLEEPVKVGVRRGVEDNLRWARS